MDSADIQLLGTTNRSSSTTRRLHDNLKERIGASVTIAEHFTSSDPALAINRSILNDCGRLLVIYQQRIWLRKSAMSIYPTCLSTRSFHVDSEERIHVLIFFEISSKFFDGRNLDSC